MSDTYVLELPLKTTPFIEKKIDIRLEEGRKLYNAVLKEALKRYSLVKESKLWKKAKKEKEPKYFQEAKKFYEFSDYSLQKFAIKTKNRCCIKDHLDTHVCQKLATRAFSAVDKYLKRVRGRPRYKRKGWISSLEGKDNKSGIKFRNNKIAWKGLKIEVIFDKKDPYLVEANALNSKIKFCRIVKKNIKGKNRYFVQLILEGKPLIKEKNKTQNEIVGLDIGPSTIAIYSSKKAELKAFCQEIDPLTKDIAALQKKMDRSRRKTNPQNYEKDGTIKKGKKKWVKSNHYKKYQKELSQKHRNLKERRKRSHGKLVNSIISLGNIIKIEKISYKGWQKIYGKSINKRAPSNFIQRLRRKVENTGGQLEEFSTQKTCLSQICHKCNIKKKKKLSDRWHECCDISCQRDLYSAFLAYHVVNDVLDISQVALSWPSAQSLLEQAMSRLNQVAIGKSRLASFGLSQRQSSSLVKDRSDIDEIGDVVGNIPRAPKSLYS